MKRRNFLKLAGMGSLSFAAAACTPETDKTIYSMVQAPADMVTGAPKWYASTCRECPAGCGIIAKNREGRIIKVEGNPLHPINKGKLCLRGQAALQGLYHPDRLKAPLLKVNEKWQPISFDEAVAHIQNKAKQAANKGRGKVRILTETVGDSLMALFGQCLSSLDSDVLMVFEPLAYEALKTANKEVFGIDGLPGYRMDRADCLVSFGADFLETWLSPVEYARQFNKMHGLKENGDGADKGFFAHISAYQSLTGANADIWASCVAGTEAVVALALLRSALELGRGAHLSSNLIESLKNAVASFTPEAVVAKSGIEPEAFEAIRLRLLNARTPLVIGTGNGAGEFALDADRAANLLNLVLDPSLACMDFDHRYRVEQASRRADVNHFFGSLASDDVRLLLINNANPVYAQPAGSGIVKALESDRLFVVAFTNFMDETAGHADLVFPVSMPLESWDEFSGKSGMLSLLQPAMGQIREMHSVGDMMMKVAQADTSAIPDYKTWLMTRLFRQGAVAEKVQFLRAVQRGGRFDDQMAENQPQPPQVNGPIKINPPAVNGEGANEERLRFIAIPSIRFFDGRGANRPWLCEIPDPLTKVAWQTTVMAHPETVAAVGAVHGDVVNIKSDQGQIETIIYAADQVRSGTLVMAMGQGHTEFGRYAKNIGTNPIALLTSILDNQTGGPVFTADITSLSVTGKKIPMAHTDGSRIQHGRKIALSVTWDELHHHPKNGESHAGKDGGHAESLTMEGFPFTLPLPEGYDSKRDFYAPHSHDTYRWGMVVDLDKCIGCSACAAACYAENNIGIVGKDRILEGREMAWMRVERYTDPQAPEKVTFFPMMCQHCDNAPCEPVCPVYAPHHSNEGLNNQIYNRCIGTRFCSQNCPYKVRRFNWFEWEWPEPMNLQLNPDVTVRSKGVMEKCSFCVQRIKEAHGVAKDEKRKIKDGEVVPACVQTCPTDALTFGNLMDVNSKVRLLTGSDRAYQAMGYLNAKPAVIYLKKVIHKI